MLKIDNATIVTNGKIKGNQRIVIDSGKIVFVGDSIDEAFDGEVIDARGDYVSSGMIDIHTHGMADTDFNNLKDVKLLTDKYLQSGATSVIATTMTAPIKELSSILQRLRVVVANSDVIKGAHLEGPFFTQKNAGAQDKGSLSAVNDNTLQFIDEYNDVINRVSFAPDVVGARKLVERCNKYGIALSMGHDNSIDDEIDVVYNLGVKCVTHMYCCTSFVRRRDDNVKHLGLCEYAMATDDIKVEIIADRHHIPDKLFDYVYKVKGYKNICLVSDSIRTIDNNVNVVDNVAIISGTNTYAGSVTPVFNMVQNIVKYNNVPLNKAIYMATENPAKVAKLDKVGQVKRGFLADLVIFDNDINLKTVIKSGQIVNRQNNG